MSLSAEVKDALTDMVRKALDRHQEHAPAHRLSDRQEAVGALQEELRAGVESLIQKVTYFAPPEHVDASAAHLAAVALSLAGLVGRVGRNEDLGRG